MPSITLASSITQRVGRGPGEWRIDCVAPTVEACLEAAFADSPALRGYLLDEHGRVRPHVAVFVDGRALRDKSDLGIPLEADAEIHVFQALSGG
ncbi:MoaD/ThiS family protein [Pseudomarimonas salicorniae]|uniref:MoaD/ThiS family protein n=1 Tax=Pseudomarimonas salicorniae TaxID=2933270 RepID=A0ABT0GIN6_9GAMM|nr:MoaD/ThiS family protein [Lysobacter sp. CAU 1642]MCK7594409.1 MoaD/ThiS family protein [Lysobacter sp. CAU 1642]